MRHILVLCLSKFQSRKPNNCWLWIYEFREKSKSRKNLKTSFLHNGFSSNLVHKTGFLNLGFCSIFVKFWHSNFVKDYSVFGFYLWRRANARNVRLYYPYWQYILRPFYISISILCWFVGTRFFNTFSLKVIYVRFWKGCRISK